MSEVKNLLQIMFNEMVDLKKNNNENQSNNRGFNRPPFRRPNQPPQNPPPPNPSKGFTSENIFSILKVLATGTYRTFLNPLRISPLKTHNLPKRKRKMTNRSAL